MGRCTASSSSLNVCFRGHGLEIPLIQSWRSDSAFLLCISGLTEGRVISLRSSFTFWCCRMLSVFSCECGLLQSPATVFGERLQRILSFRGGRTEPLFVYSISWWCVCVCVRAAATLKLSMTVASVQVTPAVSSLLEFETIRASLETSVAVQDSFCPFCTL